MTLDTFITIVGIVGLVVLPIVRYFADKNMKLTYKDQTVGGGRHG